MELKEYQQRALDQVKRYLEALDSWREKNRQVIKTHGSDVSLDFPYKAWDEVVKAPYHSRKNGIGEYLPNFCLKIPTGGGKTLLAVKAIDLINTIYRKKQTGLVLWVVPTTQIYRQTIQHLRNREHPYRQHLDIASGGRTMILEKTDRFTPLDVTENLVVMMLMLPAANRQNKETLKVFKDSGGFETFFPPEDDIEGHIKLLEKYPNLDAFGAASEFFGRQAKTSLGNTLRLLSPVIILDEGHKAYSENAQHTLRGFNPCMIVELSATPTKESNILVDIRGVELAREEMIKLDLHIINKLSADWVDTMLASVERRNLLEEKAKEYRANTDEYIRPICLVQVERTGKDQRSARYIHAEDVHEYLVKVCGIPEEQVAIKTSEKDDIEGLDLFDRDCQVRYIITKQALQEGWDCAFAYVLTILTNPSSQNNLTQLVGRILRQPFARKTKVKELDESYVFCFQQRGRDLLENIRTGFKQEGLADLAGRVVSDSGFEGEGVEQGEKIVEMRERFRKFSGKILLPVFVKREGDSWQRVSYEMDLVSRIAWEHADFSPLYDLSLGLTEDRDTEVAVGLSEDEKEVIKQKGIVRLKEGGLSIDSVFVARHLIDIISNPWISYQTSKQVLDKLLNKYDANIIANNLVFIVEEIRKKAAIEKDRLAEEVFRGLIKQGELRFLLLRENAGYRIPSRLRVSNQSRTLTRKDNQPLQSNLFDFVPDEEFNSLERDVAWYLEDQGQLMWWYRNLSRSGYAVQGWQKHRVYPDFVFSKIDQANKEDYDKVFVVETKGLHLKNEDTQYKERLFDLCNALAEEKSWSEIGLELVERKVKFKVVYENDWMREFNALFEQHILEQ